MDFADRVKHIREELRLTQMELAKQLNVSFATVNRWENKAFRPSALAQKVIYDFCKQNNVKLKNTEGDVK